ncbi:hypothetical protein ILUMI_05644 [Ignelater luminosus]|uniref:Eukaryotic translation initiation factor 2A n=1 Tax=Ignelater luminosus TaxID=2038154 RepID=A0A8K0DA39_IGNLU|nr:hypothetical protein ILUMI_05644 [Ignelater luminosus]
MESAIPIAVRSSSGISVNWGPPKFTINDAFEEVRSKGCRAMLFSPNGDYFAYVIGQNLHILKTSWESIAVLQGTKGYHLTFSPKGTYLCSWEYFTVNNSNPQGSPNLNVYKTENGELVKGFICKKQTNWEPQWSSDEFLCSRLINTDVVFYEDNNFNNIVHRISAPHKVTSYSLSPTSGSYFVVCHTQGNPGQPSFVRLFKYPNFDNHQTLANKSFFQADKVEYYWNSKGTHVLLLAMTEVDKTGGSYYGKQSLHFIGTNGQTSLVSLSKEGPIHSVAWSPKTQEFCVIYGFMPSKTTIFNLKCDPIFEFGTGPRNSIYYNPQGNILLLGGFGNLQGQVELWETNSRKIIGKCEAPDSTHLQWSPDGIHFLTATTAPRLRTGNGYKIWHYSGALIFERPWSKEVELYDVCWQKYPKSVFKESAVSFAKVESIASSQPQASKQVYRPPSARNRPAVSFKLHDDEEPAHKPGGDGTPSKAALKQKKKRENRKARKQEETDDPASPSNGSTSTPVVSNVQVVLTGDPEKDKKIKNIKKKLDAIAKLKEQQSQGKTLEINQLAKIKGEDDLLKELKQLQL